MRSFLKQTSQRPRPTRSTLAVTTWGCTLPVAILGPSGRTHATVSALLLARGLAGTAPTELLRVALPGDPPLSLDARPVPGLVVSDVVADGPEGAAALANGRLEAAGEARIVLDLPIASLGDPRLRARIALSVLAVGPSPLDEMAAANAYARSVHVDGAPAWMLGCARPGGTAAARAFADEMTALCATRTDRPARTMSAVLPPLGHVQEYWVLNGAADVRANAVAAGLADMVDQIRRSPDADPPEPADDDALALDDRPPEARLRALADDLDDLRQGRGPCARHLATAPVIEDWSYSTAPRRVISGTVVSGHPRIKAGRSVVTSEVFACDGRSFARTLGRWYRLRDRRAS